MSPRKMALTFDASLNPLTHDLEVSGYLHLWLPLCAENSPRSNRYSKASLLPPSSAATAPSCCILDCVLHTPESPTGLYWAQSKGSAGPYSAGTLREGPLWIHCYPNDSILLRISILKKPRS